MVRQFLKVLNETSFSKGYHHSKTIEASHGRHLGVHLHSSTSIRYYLKALECKGIGWRISNNCPG